MNQQEPRIEQLTSICLDYVEKRISPAVFEVLVEGIASQYHEPTRSELYRSAERTVNEHHCWFWRCCRDGFCDFEGNEDLIQLQLSQFGARLLLPVIESEAIQ